MTPWAIAHQLPLSMRFSRQEYGSGLPYLRAEDLPNPEIKACIGSQGLKKETKFKEYSTEKGIESFEGKKGVQPHGKIMDLGEKMGK